MITLAQLTNPVLPPSIGSGDTSVGGEVVGRMVGSLVGLIYVGAFILAMFFLVLGGVQWITSGGDKAGLESARNKIIHALMGLIIVAAAWAITDVVGKFLGLDIANLPIPSFGGP